MNFKHLSFLIGAIAASGISGRVAHAQEATITEAVSDDSYDANALTNFSGRGFHVSDTVFVHAAVGLEGGFDDNVFFNAKDPGREMPIGSGLMQQTALLSVASDKAKREDLGEAADNDDAPVELTPRDAEYRVGLRAAYEEFLSGDQTVRRQHRLNVSSTADFVAKPDAPLSFVVAERFIRDSRSPNYEDTSTIDRDDNNVWMGARLRPDGHTFSDTLYYDNWFNVFENDPSVPNRMNHTFGLLHEWDVQPSVAKVWGDVSYGFFGPIGNGSSSIYGPEFKTKSQPFRAVAGFNYALTELSWFRVQGGYAHASYDRGEGYSAPVAAAELGYRWTKLGRAVAEYSYDHYDSINANFYRDHLFALKLVQQLGFAVLDGGPEIRLRHFGGIPAAFGMSTRDDFVAAVHARLQMILADRYSLSADYRYATVRTDYRIDGVDNPGFARNEFMLGIWTAY